MDKYYFFKAVKARKHVHLVALPGQKYLDLVGSEGIGKEEDIDYTKEIKCMSSEELVDGKIYWAVNSNFLKYEKRCKPGNFYYAAWVNILDKKDTEAMKYYGAHFSTGTTKEEKTEKKEKEVVSTPKVSTFLSELLSDATLKAPSSSKDGFYMSESDWSLLIRNIKKGINTMIIGPCGVGKTTAVKEACERLGKKLHIFDMGSMIDPISSLLGVHRLEGGKSVFDFAEFTKAIQEPCVILLDELSRAPLATNNVLFPCLDDRRKLSIEVASSSESREILVHPEVCFIATANIGSEYTGTNVIDRALLNRFMPLELSYIPEKEESKVLVTRCGIDQATADLIVKISNNIRNLAKQQKISVSLSVRETLMVAELVRDGWTLGNAMERIYLPLYEGTNTEGERNVVFKTITSY